MQNLHLLEFSAEAFWCYVYHYQCLIVRVTVPLGLPSIDNGAHGTEKLLLRTQVSKDLA
jgi:hypothetical protein